MVISKGGVVRLPPRVELKLFTKRQLGQGSTAPVLVTSAKKKLKRRRQK